MSRAERRLKKALAALDDVTDVLASRPCSAQYRVGPSIKVCWQAQPDYLPLDPKGMCRECLAAFHVGKARELVGMLARGEAP